MRRGFTLLEIAIVLAVTSLTVPLVFVFYRQYDAEQRVSLARVEAAQSMRAVSEELRRDLWVLRWADDKSLVLVGTGTCKEVTYELDAEGILLRRAGSGCGSTRPVTRNVRSITRDAQGLVVTFAKRVRGPEEVATVFRLGLTPEPSKGAPK